MRAPAAAFTLGIEAGMAPEKIAGLLQAGAHEDYEQNLLTIDGTLKLLLNGGRCMQFNTVIRKLFGLTDGVISQVW